MIIASKDSEGHVYAYNLSKNKLVTIYKLGIEPLRHNVIADVSNQKVYIYTNGNTSSDMFFEIDIKHKSCITYKGLIHGLPEGLGHETGGDMLLCILNNTIHAIGGYSCAYHLIWNNHNDNKLHTFSQHSIGDRKRDQPLYGHCVIALESTQQILVLGGKSNSIFGGYLQDIWCCDCRDRTHFSWNKWTKTKMPNKMSDFGYMMY